MEKIEAYKTDDGKIFETENEAKDHEREEQLKRDIRFVVEDLMDENDMISEKTIRFLIDKKRNVYNILKTYYESERKIKRGEF